MRWVLLFRSCAFPPLFIVLLTPLPTSDLYAPLAHCFVPHGCVQGDACDLPESLGKFNVVHAVNLLCRLPNPRYASLARPRFPSRLAPCGWSLSDLLYHMCSRLAAVHVQLSQRAWGSCRFLLCGFMLQALMCSHAFPLFSFQSPACHDRAFLERLVSLVAPGGLVVLISPYSWLPGYTSPDKWIGRDAQCCGSTPNLSRHMHPMQAARCTVGGSCTGV